MPRKTACAILFLAVMLLGLRYGPEYSKVETLDASVLVELRQRNLPVPPQPAVHGRTAKRARTVRIFPNVPLNVRGLEDPTGDLTTFYEALWRTQAKAPGAVTRVLHYGDSPVTADSITADARSLLQRRFGDAGHGFVLIAKPWAWYNHRGIHLTSHGWQIQPASQSHARDNLHGLGGVNFIGSPGASSTIDLPDDQHTRAEIYFEQQPGGGMFTVTAGNTLLGEVDTTAPDKAPGFRVFQLPPETRQVTLAVQSGLVRLFGWSFEKDGPGIIYDSLGLNGAQVQVALRYFEPKQWAEELQHENPDLVVINYGTNESVYPAYIERYYENELRALIGRVRAAVPRASMLIMSPMDRGVREEGRIVTPDVLPRIVEIQAKVARETGCAFFNTFQAMGGAGTMAKWYASEPRLVSADFMHPLPGGAAIVGRLLNAALVDGFERFLKSRMQARAHVPES